MEDRSHFDQRGQRVIGQQINVAGDATLPPPPLVLVPHLPPPPGDFTGRDEELQYLLAGFDQGATITGLRGMGGIGKTALAYALAEKLADRYPDGQILIELRGTSPETLSAGEAMARVVRAYHPEFKPPDSEAELAGVYRSLLHDLRVLLLLDNAASREQVEPLLPPPGCAALVTSRYKFTLPGMPEPFSLDVLKPPEARELLLRICPRIGDQAEELAELCGFLPLALRAAASLLAVKSDISPPSYLEELRSERTRLEKIGKEGVELDVESSLDLSYRRLEPERAVIFALLSVFPGDFDAAAEEVVCQDEGHRHLSELVRWSLVEYQKPGEEGEGRYYLHDLVRLFAAKRLEEAGDEAARYNAQQRHSKHFKEVLSSATELYQNGGTLAGLESFDRERMNIEAGWKWAKKYLMDNNAAATLCNAFLNLPYLLVLRMHPRELIMWLETAVAAARSLMDQSAEGRHLGNLGNAQANLGETRKAIKHYEKALAISEEIGDRRIEGVDLGNLGNAYADLGETRKAIEYYEQALAIARETGDRRNEGNFLGNLGLVYADLDETQRALEYNQQSLAIAREIKDRRGEGNSLGSLGIVYKKMCEPQKAIEHFLQALAIAREIKDRRGEGNSLGSLGIVYKNIGKLRKAIEHYQQALAIFRMIGDRRCEGISLCNLGSAYADLGETNKAIKYYQQALAISREISDRQGEANALFNMSLAQDSLGNRAEGFKLAKEALAIFEQIESPYAEQVRRQLAKWQG